MYKQLNTDSYLQSPGPSMYLLPHDSRRHASVMLSHQEEEDKEEAGEFLLICHNTVGCGEFCHADDAQWSTDEQPIHSELSTTSSLAECDPSVYLSHHQMEGITDDYVEVSQYFTGGCCCEGLQMETNGFLEAPCWAESPCVHYGVRRNMVVGVEVVEEVAVEEELEVMLEDVQADDLLDIEVLQHEHLYPT